MARAVANTNQHIYGTHDWVRVGLLGAALGIIALALSWLVGTYIIDPLLCRSGALTACRSSSTLAANIALVLATVAGAAAMIRLRTYRFVGVSFAVLVAFWGMASLLAGLSWFEMAAWSAGIGALGYLLFMEIFRIRSLFIAVVAAAAAILLIRWVAFL